MYSQTYQELINRAIEYTEQNDYAAAEQVYKAALKKDPANPNNVLLITNLATIQRTLGKYDDALLSYNIVISKYPNANILLHSRAALYCEMNDYDNALKDYNSIINNDPMDIDAIYRKGLIHLSQKNIFAAEEDFDRILEIDSKSLLGRSGLAMVMKARSEWEDAEMAYTKLISENINNPGLYLNRAECYLELKKLARTQSDIDKMIELDYDDAPLYILRGKLRLAQYDKSSAKGDFMKAKEKGADETMINNLLQMCK